MAMQQQYHLLEGRTTIVWNFGLLLLSLHLQVIKLFIVGFFSNGVYESIARDMTALNWSIMYRMNDCQDQANFFYTVLHGVVDKFAPVTKFVVKNNDKPWINLYFKNQVKLRNAAYVARNDKLYKRLRNKVNRLRANLKKKFCNDRIKCLKVANNVKRWKEVKSLVGLGRSNTSV